jgi:hypothetical protein
MAWSPGTTTVVETRSGWVWASDKTASGLLSGETTGRAALRDHGVAATQLYRRSAAWLGINNRLTPPISGLTISGQKLLFTLPG